jgi:hypothetical protein
LLRLPAFRLLFPEPQRQNRLDGSFTFRGWRFAAAFHSPATARFLRTSPRQGQHSRPTRAPSIASRYCRPFGASNRNPTGPLRLSTLAVRMLSSRFLSPPGLSQGNPPASAFGIVEPGGSSTSEARLHQGPVFLSLPGRRCIGWLPDHRSWIVGTSLDLLFQINLLEPDITMRLGERGVK